MIKRLQLVLWVLLITAVTSCSARLGEPVSVPRGETVKFAGGDLEIRTCSYLREYLAPDDENEFGYEEVYNKLAITVDGEDFEIERPVGMEVVTIEGYEITIVEMEPEPEVMCTVIVERIN